MFQWLIQDDLAISAIANRLYSIPVLTDLDRPWNYSAVRQVLTNEMYIGNNVYNRHWSSWRKR